jgi:hypothetical protein
MPTNPPSYLPGCPLGQLATPPLYTHRPPLTLRLTRKRSDVKVPLKSVRFGCVFLKRGRPGPALTPQLPGKTPQGAATGGLGGRAPVAGTRVENTKPSPMHASYACTVPTPRTEGAPPRDRSSHLSYPAGASQPARQHTSPTRQERHGRHRGPPASRAGGLPGGPLGMGLPSCAWRSPSYTRRSPHRPPASANLPCPLVTI